MVRALRPDAADNGHSNSIIIAKPAEQGEPSWKKRNFKIADLGLVVLPITLDHAERQAGLPWHHRDPFDRLLVAQAQVEGVPLVSADAVLDVYGITRLW